MGVGRGGWVKGKCQPRGGGDSWGWVGGWVAGKDSVGWSERHQICISFFKDIGSIFKIPKHRLDAARFSFCCCLFNDFVEFVFSNIFENPEKNQKTTAFYIFCAFCFRALVSPKFGRVPPRGWSGARVGVGMSKGAIFRLLK